MAISLGEIAKRFGCELKGDADVPITTVASLSNADSDALSFLSSPAFKQQLSTTRAAAVILRAADADDCPVNCLLHDNPYACYARVAGALHPVAALKPGVHSSAVIAATAKIARSAQISAHVTIGEHSAIGENTYVGPGCVIGENCSVANDGRLIANVTVVHRVSIGARFIAHPGVVLGTDGFGNAMSAEGWVKVPQLGGLRIGDDVEIGANSAIDLGALDDTVIENGVRIDNLVHLAHNVRVGEHSAIAAQSGFAGSTTVGKRCMFAGQTGIVGHVTICDDVILNGKSVITKNIEKPGVYSNVFPAEPVSEWNRRIARFRRLDNLIKRVTRLEKDKS